MAEVDSASASKDSALPASPTVNGDTGDKALKTETDVKSAKTLQQRYIELLEEKIARLEAEIKLGKRDDDDEKKDGKDVVSATCIRSILRELIMISNANGAFPYRGNPTAQQKTTRAKQMAARTEKATKRRTGSRLWR
jgi:hypothetical protein